MVSRREKGGEGISLEIRGLRKHFEFWLVKHVNVLYTLKISKVDLILSALMTKGNKNPRMWEGTFRGDL